MRFSVLLRSLLASALTAVPVTAASEDLPSAVKNPLDDVDASSLSTLFQRKDGQPLHLRSLQQERSIVEIVVQTEVLSTLEAALIAADLVDDLSGAGPYTVLAPWDVGFAALPDGLVAKLLQPEWILHLQDLLLYHVHLGSIPFDLNVVTQSIDMANGEQVQLTNEPERHIYFNQAQNIAFDFATNGFAYMLDNVLTPTSITSSLVDVASSSPALTTLTQLVIAAGLDGALSDPAAGFTVFAPNDAAFADLDPDLVDFLLSPEGLETLQAVLLYHVVDGVFPSTLIPQGTTVLPSLLEGNNLAVTKTGGSVQVNNVPVVIADVLANNGIAHVISGVLIPPIIGSPPTPAPVPPTQPTLFGIVSTSPDHTTLASLVSTAGLGGALDDPSADITLFAPNDDAFALVDPAVLAFLQTPEGLVTLQDLLLYHGINGALPSITIPEGTNVVPSLEGSNLVVTKTGESVLVNDVPVIAADVSASNGVIHVIPEVLLQVPSTRRQL